MATKVKYNNFNVASAYVAIIVIIIIMIGAIKVQIANMGTDSKCNTLSFTYPLYEPFT